MDADPAEHTDPAGAPAAPGGPAAATGPALRPAATMRTAVAASAATGPALRPAATMRTAVAASAATSAFAFTVGVLARKGGFGFVAPTVFSATTFAGASQAAAITTLTAGGGVVAAIVGAVLINLRYLTIGMSVARYFKGGPLRRFFEAQLVADVNWALAYRGHGVYDRKILVRGGFVMWALWVVGTVAGLAVGGVIGSPQRYGLDGVMPAMFVAVLIPQLRSRRLLAAGALGAVLVLVTIPFLPPGLPIVAGIAAIAIGRRRKGPAA